MVRWLHEWKWLVCYTSSYSLKISPSSISSISIFKATTLCKIMRLDGNSSKYLSVFFKRTFLKIKLKIECFHLCWVYAHITRFHWGLQNLHWKPSSQCQNKPPRLPSLNMQKCKISELWWRGRFSVSNLFQQKMKTLSWLALMMFQSFKTLVYLWNTNAGLMKPERFLLIHLQSIQPKSNHFCIDLRYMFKGEMHSVMYSYWFLSAVVSKKFTL